MRLIDPILEAVKTAPGLSDIERELLKRRIEQPPSHDELDLARKSLYPLGRIDGWTNRMVAR